MKLELKFGPPPGFSRHFIRFRKGSKGVMPNDAEPRILDIRKNFWPADKRWHRHPNLSRRRLHPNKFNTTPTQSNTTPMQFNTIPWPFCYERFWVWSAFNFHCFWKLFPKGFVYWTNRYGDMVIRLQKGAESRQAGAGRKSLVFERTYRYLTRPLVPQDLKFSYQV